MAFSAIKYSNCTVLQGNLTNYISASLTSVDLYRMLSDFEK